MNKGINDLFKLIENETSKSGARRRRRDFDNDKKSRSKLTSKNAEDINQRILKDTYISSSRGKNDEELEKEFPDLEYKRDLKECTFTPDINKKSVELNTGPRPDDCFEHLYALGIKNNQLKEEKVKERAEQLQAKSIENCTFKPVLDAFNRNNSEIFVPKYEEKIEERAMKIAIEKKRRIEDYEKEKANKIDSECTFQPKMIPRVPQEENIEQQINVQSIDKYLERMSLAKELKERNEKQWKEKVGSGNYWKGEMTIPEAPKLSSQQKVNKKNKSLLKPISFMEALGKANESTPAKRHQNYPQTIKANEFLQTESQAKMLLNKKNQKEKELLKIDEKMNYEDALWAIHSHIVALDV